MPGRSMFWQRVIYGFINYFSHNVIVLLDMKSTQPNERSGVAEKIPAVHNHAKPEAAHHRFTRPLRTTLIGVGGFGQTHRTVIRQLEEQNLLRLTDVVDPSPETSPETYNLLRNQGVRWNRSWEEFESMGETPDCVFIAAPIHLHADYARQAVRTGARVYLEKPPVPLLGQMEELMALEDDGPQIQVGFTFPYSTQMRTLRQWIESGRLGKIESYRLSLCWPRGDQYYQRARWAGRLWLDDKPVLDGPATNALAHRIHDLLTIEAYACGEVAVPAELWAEMYRARPIETYDVCCARGVFPSGAEFGITLSHACAVERELAFEIRGSRGWARLCGTDLALTSSFISETITSEEEPIVAAFRDFVECARTGAAPLVGLAETRPYVAMTNAMFISSQGIHSIDSGHIQEVESPTGRIYDVDEIHNLSAKAFQTGLNFSELDADWGVPGKLVQPDELSSLEIHEWFRRLSQQNQKGTHASEHSV